jgi:mRNA-degrading endonuclease RelE of RelBE toxin-antitoxin system
MKIEFSEAFLKQSQKLPDDVVAQFEKQKQFLVDNPRHPSLHLKKLQDYKDVYSIRASSSYRALFILKDDTAVFFALGHRKDVYR